MKYQLDTHLFITYTTVFMVTSKLPDISNYCYLELLTVSNRRRSEGCIKYHPLPQQTYSAYSGSQDNSSAGD